MTDHVPRDLGGFPITESLAELLGELRARGGATGPGEVDADAVRAVEIGVVFRFPNDVLAMWAADVPALVAGCGVDLNRVVAHTGELRDRGARGDLVGLARTDDAFVCVAKSQESELDHPLRSSDVTVWQPGGRSRVTPLTTWLSEQLAALGPAAGPAAPFRPRLSRVLPGGASGRRVRHATFGEGTVFLEIGSGPTRKVKVAFPRVGLKLLQARFLEFLD